MSSILMKSLTVLRSVGNWFEYVTVPSSAVHLYMSAWAATGAQSITATQAALSETT
jgi:hypothetical protein